jgi:hypothetical protein
MLTQVNYNALWTNVLGLPLQGLPIYYIYLQREVYFQDYLDLFCCPRNEGPSFERTILNGRHTVSIPGLQPDPNGEYTLIDAQGHVRLIVQYDFPYYGKLCENRSIKYILIGEAPPSTGNYIYKGDNTGYITAPLSAMGIGGLGEFERLVAFADAGYLLLDLFPFAIDFKNTIINRTMEGFFNNPNLGVFILSLLVKIRELNCISVDWDYCFVAPKRTSLSILNWLDANNNSDFNGKSTIHPLDIVGGPNFIDAARRVHPAHTSNNNINIWPITHLTRRAKFTVAVGQQVPNARLIRRVFFLP